MATKRDYYDILGVSKSATAEEIKRAYRKLAMEHHPDKHGGDDAKFKEIGEAYDTLKDPQKKTGYDQFGHAGAGGNPFGGGAGGGQAGGAQGFGGFDFNGAGFDFSDILNQFMGGAGGGGATRGPARGRDLEVSVTIDFADAVFGTETDVTVTMDDACEHCTGSGAEPGTKLKTCDTCKGRGQVVRVQQTILGAVQQASVCPTCAGRGQVPEKACSVCRGAGVLRRSKKLSIKIPAGVDDGATMRLTGQGAAARGGGPRGDLYVQIRIRRDRRFERDGRDILSDTGVSMTEAALGTEVSVETVDGPVTLKVPAGTQSGKVFKLSGRGVPGLGGRSRGDHLVTVTVDIPTKLSAKQRQLLEEFAAESTAGKKGFFKR
ncbi:MAG TPA: molecular chaperone DnaJ [Candidatus Saccharimonadia bacterium]|nr:molecular chaperone DnaJ [Candidatus Saccharimonadia bacterium]